MEQQDYGRTRVWISKDTLPRELQFLQPLNASSDQVARIMVGPRQIMGSIEGSDQTAVASFANTVTFNLNTLFPGMWTAPAPAVGIVWELIRANITCRDISAKLQITIPLLLSTSPGANLALTPYPTPVPFTLPPYIGAAYEIRATTPCLPYLPNDGALTNGPSAQFGLLNTDGAASHTYRRGMFTIFRYIYDVDYSKERVYVMGTLV